MHLIIRTICQPRSHFSSFLDTEHDPQKAEKVKHQVQWNRRNLRTWIVDVGLCPVAEPQDAWWRSLCPATCLWAEYTGNLFSDRFPPKNLHRLLSQMWPVTSLAPSALLITCVSCSCRLPGAIRRWSEAKRPPALGLEVTKQKWAKAPVFCFCHCFHFRPQEQPAEVPFPLLTTQDLLYNFS